MFWKKRIDSDEYKELKLQTELLWIEVDILRQRKSRKLKAADIPEETGESKIDDGFDALRKLHKEHKP